MKSLLIKNLKRRKTPWVIYCSLKREMVAICELFKTETPGGEAWQILKDKTCFVLLDGKVGVVDFYDLDLETTSVDVIDAQDVISVN